MRFRYSVSKARRPKFELLLKIIDLNNVPLVSGTSYVKWHLPSSTAAEHRGRTEKVPIKEHKVTWDYEKVIAVRLTMDKTNLLQESVINFEVVQDYSTAGRGEKITLGHVSLNLAEYAEVQGEDGEDGITRRYLMQESKINSTLKVGVIMHQLDGERNFDSPPLKAAPVFDGIAGIMDFEQTEHDDLGHMPSINRSREAAELQDMYRLTLAASWGAQPGELPADQCIEAIFAGGDGWNSTNLQDGLRAPHEPSITGDQQSEGDSMPNHKRRNRTHSVGSSRSRTTITGKRIGQVFSTGREGLGSHVRSGSRSSMGSHQHGSLSESSERGEFKRVHEVDEFDIREDLVAWKLPG